MEFHRRPWIAISTVALSLVSFAATATSQAKVTTANGDVVLYTQKNLVDHLTVGDSVELAMAKLAVSRTQNAAVRDFATMLVTDHSAHLEKLRTLASKKDIGREANPADTSAAHLTRQLAELQAMPADSGFDRAFVQAQIAHHEAALAGLNSLKTAATDGDVKKDIDQTLPVLENHLSRAKQVAAQLTAPAKGADR